MTFKALADDTRLRILALLTEGGLCVCDLVAILDRPQSTVIPRRSKTGER